MSSCVERVTHIPDSEYGRRFHADAGIEARFDEVNTPGGLAFWHRKGGGDLPILLVHGFGGDWHSLMYQAAHLSSDYDVWLVDLPGHGASRRLVGEGPFRGLQVDVVADAVYVGLVGLGVGPFHVVGLSMGGLVAVHLAERHTRHVLSLTLVSGALVSLLQRIASLRAIVSSPLSALSVFGQAVSSSYDTPPVVRGLILRNRQWLRRYAARPELLDPEWIEEALQKRTGLLVNLGAFANGFGYDFESHVRGLRQVRTTLIVGSEDSFIGPSDVDAFCGWLPGTAVITVEGAGHWIPAEGSNVLSSEIERVLRDLRAS